MIALIQRVSSAAVEVNAERVAQIKQGILMLLGVEGSDSAATAEKMMTRVLAYRIFADGDGRMNRSLSDIDGDLLIVPQFTLAADTGKGLRPSLDNAAEPALAKELFQHALDYASSNHSGVEAGIFGADMQVHLVNDGPVTFNLRAD